jgi:uncharacterized protein YkwD
MSTTELARPDAHATGSVSTNSSRSRRSALLGALLALVVLVAVSCDATKANTDYAMVNGVRARSGLAPLARSAELDIKAAAHAAAMASSGTLYHSNLSAGVRPGWTALGENVAYASSVESAQQNLEASPPHLANMLNPAFNQVGVGVRTVNGTTYVVQVFAGR